MHKNNLKKDHNMKMESSIWLKNCINYKTQLLNITLKVRVPLDRLPTATIQVTLTRKKLKKRNLD